MKLCVLWHILIYNFFFDIWCFFIRYRMKKLCHKTHNYCSTILAFETVGCVCACVCVCNTVFVCVCVCVCVCVLTHTLTLSLSLSLSLSGGHAMGSTSATDMAATPCAHPEHRYVLRCNLPPSFHRLHRAALRPDIRSNFRAILGVLELILQWI